MLERLQWYREGSIGLGALISDLQALNSALRNPSEERRRGFGPLWATLEEVYAVMLYRKRTGFNKLNRRLVKEPVTNLTLLTSSETARE